MCKEKDCNRLLKDDNFNNYCQRMKEFNERYAAILIYVEERQNFALMYIYIYIQCIIKLYRLIILKWMNYECVY